MRKAVGLGTTLALAGILAGCSPVVQMPTPPPDPTATPVFASDEEALAAAVDAYARYLEVADQVGQGGWKDVDPLPAVARGDALDEVLETASEFSAKGFVQVGSGVFDSVSLQQVVDDGRGRTVVTIYLCLDVTAVDVIDADGVSVVSTERPPRQPLEVDIDDKDGSLKISRSDAWSGASFC